MPSFVPYVIFTSSVMRLAVSSASASNSNNSAAVASAAASIDTNASEAVSQGIRDLVELAPFHGFAERGLHILRSLAAKEGPCDVDIGGAHLNFFASEEDAAYLWGSDASTTAHGSSAAVVQARPGQPSWMGSSLFCRFPMRGLSSLDQAGFAILTEK